MTTFNTDYNNTELLDQELTIEELEAVAGGLVVPISWVWLDIVLYEVSNGCSGRKDCANQAR